MKIRYGLALTSLVLSSFAAGIYSQTTPVNPTPKVEPPAVPQNIAPVIPPNIYSGESLGYKVTSSNATKIEGYFVIKVNGNWLPLPEEQPTLKRVELR